jgi:hypothetical protein
LAPATITSRAPSPPAPLPAAEATAIAPSDMGKDPWTDPDPRPGDFDAELDRARSDQIDIHEGNPNAKLSILVSVKALVAKLEGLGQRVTLEPAVA